MPDRPSLEQLYDEHADALFGFLLNLTRKEADARDLIQELFLKVARRPELLDHAHQPRAFLLRTAYHLFVDEVRKRRSWEKRELEAVTEALCLFQSLEGEADPEWAEAVGRVLGELPQEQRAVLHLKLWQGHTFAEISLILGIPGNTAASRYRYALDKMESLLRPTYKDLYE